jgi:DNA-binding NarL/FixJ family response regulator
VYTILLIEDDPAYLEMVETILQMEGYRVITACDGLTGLSLLRESSPDLILCDIMMPEIDGHAVLQTITDEGTLDEIPFIFISALAERSDVRCGMLAGADDYLPKPFTPDDLLAAVACRIQRHRRISSRHHSLYREEQKILLGAITQRELEVLLLVGKGETSRSIATALGISLNTVEAHRANLMQKLDAPNAASLARWAFIAEQLSS